MSTSNSKDEDGLNERGLKRQKGKGIGNEMIGIIWKSNRSKYSINQNKLMNIRGREEMLLNLKGK